MLPSPLGPTESKVHARPPRRCPAPAASCGGLRAFADVGETLAAHLGLAPGAHGESFLDAGRPQQGGPLP